MKQCSHVPEAHAPFDCNGHRSQHVDGVPKASNCTAFCRCYSLLLLCISDEGSNCLGQVMGFQSNGMLCSEWC